jgi:hypothetical protein
MYADDDKGTISSHNLPMKAQRWSRGIVVEWWPISMILNPLNAELNPICHLLILLGDLTFMGTCIVSVSNKMQRYTVYLYMETALHVSGGTSTHHQERIQLYLQFLVFVTPLLLSAAIVEELELVWVCCGWRTPPITPCVLYIGQAYRYPPDVAFYYFNKYKYWVF